MDPLLEQLRQLGWTEYEAKCYLALLRSAPATGYRVARESGVPSAKVYEALAHLAERGAASRDEGAGKTSVWRAVSPAELLAGVRASQTRMLENLGQQLSAWAEASAGRAANERLTGRVAVLGRASALLANASETVMIALPAGLEASLRPALDAARAQGVRIERATEPLSAAGEIRLTLVVGRSVALSARIGRPEQDAEWEALTTRDALLVNLCADHVRMCRALAYAPETLGRLERHDAWLDFEEIKQRRLLRCTRPAESETAH